MGKNQSSVGRHKRCYGDGIRFGQLSDDPTVNDMEGSTVCTLLYPENSDSEYGASKVNNGNTSPLWTSATHGNSSECHEPSVGSH